MSGSMVLHKGARRVEAELLKGLADPISMGRFHKPIRHDELLAGLLAELALRDLEVIKADLALSPDDARLFMLFHLRSQAADVAVERAWALAVRNSVDQTFNVQGVAGGHVFVCDNLALSGQSFLFSHKNTSRLYLQGMLREGIDKYLPMVKGFDARVKQLAAAPINRATAEASIYRAFLQHGVAALRYMPAVHEAFFVKGELGPAPTQNEFPEVQANQWGLHNAFTRAFKQIESPVVKQQATQRLGRIFQL